MAVKVVTGHFQTTDAAEAALAELDRAGFTREEVSYLSRLEDTSTLQQRLEGKVEGRSGTVWGTATGGVSGMLLGIAAFALPGLGPFLGAGSLVGALVGASVGAATGGLMGALADMGVPEAEAQAWTEKMQRGGALIVITTDAADAALAKAILEGNGGETAVDIAARTVMSQADQRSGSAAVEV
ncbi:MAG TPA: hypothetical protein VES20_04475 [Bryobacteraceae bacterium]|nr:hypothetical protein [Bryobacteraceae bacterium]